MLLGNFFTISEKTATDTNVSAVIDINATHNIFEGHFPGQPVVPGVCMVQMIKEILETVIETKLQLQKADFLKFLSVINPAVNKTVVVEFAYEKKDGAIVHVNGRIFKNDITFLKFKKTFAAIA
jgi:3-hydroxyacyl-[acyl-carrier-protein] dehydratase